MNTMNTILSAAAIAFKTPRAIITALVASVSMWAIASWISNWSLLRYAFGEAMFDAGELVAFFFTGFAVPILNSPPLTLAFLVISVALTGWQAGLLAYVVGRRLQALRAAGGSAFATAVALLGVGCSACGSVILTSLLGAGATAGLVAFLPLHGAEFPLIASLILLATITRTSRRLLAPDVCPVP